jgi:uncharacterized metal-binding protein YceD (DUF177 family)
MTVADEPYTVPVDVVSLPANGRVYTLAADETVRAAVAAHLELQEVGRLMATLTVAPTPGGVELTGRFDADVTQTCVISLEPVKATLGGEIDRRFVNAPRPRPESAGKDRKPRGKKDEPEEGWVDPDEDVPDPILDGRIDLGAVVVEELALALDPYPRTSGASFKDLTAAQPMGEPRRESPFAALAGFKAGARGSARGRQNGQSRSKTRR